MLAALGSSLVVPCIDPHEPELPHTLLNDMVLSRMLGGQFFSIPGGPGKAVGELL